MRDELIYLSGACEAAEDKGKGWRDIISKELRSKGFGVINPLDVLSLLPSSNETGWEDKVLNPHTHDSYLKQVAKVELALASRCDILIAKIDKDVLKGCGTYCEVAIAYWSGKKVILWVDGLERKDIPGFLFGLYSHIVYSKHDLFGILGIIQAV